MSVKLCPKCGSDKIKFQDVGGNALFGNVFYCTSEKCSYYWIPSQQSALDAANKRVEEARELLGDSLFHIRDTVLRNRINALLEGK